NSTLQLQQGCMHIHGMSLMTPRQHSLPAALVLLGRIGDLDDIITSVLMQD
ncbi:hypothetical protein DFH29DRAFT_806253, partial [Suillus ampliporus]